MSDTQTIVERYHAVDPSTGFVATTGNYPTAFDADRKKQFLELYKAHELGIRKACRAMGMSVSTVNHHLQIDPEFKLAFDEAEKDYIENLECVSRTNALNPKSVIERIFQLKCLLPMKYGQENKPNNQNITINVSGDMLVDAKRRAEMIDAEVVKEIGSESAKMLAETLPMPDNNAVIGDHDQSC